MRFASVISYACRHCRKWHPRAARISPCSWTSARLTGGLRFVASTGVTRHVRPDTVGTFGITSAGYWGGRLFGAVARLIHYLLGERLAVWLLTYADDLWFTACGPRAFEALAGALLLLAALGVPLTWKKAKGGSQVDWVGYWVDVGRFQIGISAGRQAWLLRWLADKLEQCPVLVKEMQEGLGRLGFAAGPLEHLQPIPEPSFAQPYW